MDDKAIEAYIANLMRNEIAPAIPYEVNQQQTDEFASNVLDRFRNPYIAHQWLSITANYSSKLKMRVLPVLFNYAKTFGKAPELVAIGFAAYIRFMKPVSQKDGKYYGEVNGQAYLINDTMAGNLADLWKNNAGNIVEAVLNDASLWGKPLTEIPGFAQCVAKHLNAMDNPQLIRETVTKEAGSLVS